MPFTPPCLEDFRRDALALVRSSDKSIPVVAKELGVWPQSPSPRPTQPCLAPVSSSVSARSSATSCPPSAWYAPRYPELIGAPR
jgi:hypothetical protein